ncbi:bsp6IM [Symbiodinium necroappetens]|uniref:Bsp6IM protein n=1 Tax=Symbiodinium necroappetens TaxID=1628268 RepID=A0A813A0X6_9DINO|nr:bsp6IM [Symbiodinium necroappetens]
MLGIAYTECFGCEVNKKLQALGMKMHNYHHFYDDCCTANFLSSPTCHVFVCGAPCQPYSKAGLQKALHDPKNGEVLLWVLAWICGHQPEAFILENVEGLCTTHRETLNIILGVLARMQDSKGKKLYHVEHRVLNLCVHGHIPQNRSRLFVVGLRLDRLQGREFSWPCEIPTLPLSDFVKGKAKQGPLNNTEAKNLISVQRKFAKTGRSLKDKWVIDLSASEPHAMHDVSPCLTRTRAGSGGHYLSWLGRKMTDSEIFGLQGMSLEKFPADVMSSRELRLAAGNSIPVTLLARLMSQVLSAIGRGP